MNESTLQIRNVEVQGFGNIGHVVMRELGDRIVLEGVNGVGKTMILTAVRAALEGKTGLPDRPLAEWVKDGYESAIIKIDLADGTAIKFSIRVVITADDFDLQIKEVFEDGKSKKIPGGPMAFLKTIVNAIAFRPQQWRKKSDAEQCEEVFNLFPSLKEKLAENGKELSEAERERASELNRSKILRLDIDRASFTPGLPDKEINPAEVLEKLNKIKDHNGGLDKIRTCEREFCALVLRIDKEVDAIEKEKVRTVEMIKKLQEQIDQANIEIRSKKEERLKVCTAAEKCGDDAAHFVLIPVEPIEQEMVGVNKKNEAIRKNADRKRKQLDLEASDLKAQEIYRKITSIKEKRTKIMSSADIPIDGLSIGDGCLLYPNSSMEMVRLSALSDGEFWPVACGLVAAFKPRVGIVIVDDLFALDKGNFEQLCAASKKYGMQVWIHKTLWEEKDAGAGFLIRDGQIVEGSKTEK
jgi:hypothetical protein